MSSDLALSAYAAPQVSDLQLIAADQQDEVLRTSGHGPFQTGRAGRMVCQGGGGQAERVPQWYVLTLHTSQVRLGKLMRRI